MFLTRLGMGSKMIITGDFTQIDLPRGVTSGLKDVLDKLHGLKSISSSTSIDRHRAPPSLSEIVAVYVPRTKRRRPLRHITN